MLDIASSISHTTEYRNWQEFNIAFGGGWHMAQDPFRLRPDHLDVSFQWNPAYSGAIVDWNQWLQDFGTANLLLGDWNGTPDSPNTEVLTYTVTDNFDGAKADATYVLTKHDPFEHNTGQFEIVTDNKRDANCPATRNRGTTPIPGNGSAGENRTYTIGCSIYIGTTSSVFELFTAGFTLSSSYSVTYSSSTPAPTISVPPNYGAKTVLFDLYKRHWGTDKNYDVGGYLGLVPYDFRVPFSPGFLIEMELFPLSGGE